MTQELREQIAEFYDYDAFNALLKKRMAEAAAQRMSNGKMLTAGPAAVTKKPKADASSVPEEDKIDEMFGFFDGDEDGVLSYEEAVGLYDFLFDTESTASSPSLSREEYDQRAAGGSSANGTTEDAAAAKSSSSPASGLFDLLVFIRVFKEPGSKVDLSETFQRFLDEYEVVEDGDDEVIEVDSQQEFEKLCEQHCLQTATILPCGSLQLPDGREAGPKQLNYIYRQRGIRRVRDEQKNDKAARIMGGYQAALALTGPGAQSLGSSAQHMQIAVSAAKRDGKRIVAVFRAKQKRDMKIGITNTMVNRKYTIRAMDYVR